ncbi:hypothetical protein AOLI_G00057710 [Acnodon oligacanthus]
MELVSQYMFYMNHFFSFGFRIPLGKEKHPRSLRESNETLDVKAVAGQTETKLLKANKGLQYLFTQSELGSSQKDKAWIALLLRGQLAPILGRASLEPKNLDQTEADPHVW